MGLRDRVLALAGISERDLASAVSESFSVLRTMLTSTKAQRLVVGDGGGSAHVETFEDAALDQRHRAALALLEMAGAHAVPKAAAVNVSGRNVLVRFASYDEPQPVVVDVVDALPRAGDEGSV